MITRFLYGVFLGWLIAFQLTAYGQSATTGISLGFSQGVGITRLVTLGQQTSTPAAPHFSSPPSMGFQLGLIAEKKFSESLSLRFLPAISLNSLNIQLDSLGSTGSVNPVHYRQNDVTYLHFPLCLQWTFARTQHLNFWVQGGPQPTLNLSHHPRRSISPYQFSNFDMRLVAGAGVNIVTKNFSLSPEIRFEQGITHAAELFQNGNALVPSRYFLHGWAFVLTLER